MYQLGSLASRKKGKGSQHEGNITRITFGFFEPCR